MAIQKQNISINFAQGIDTKSDPFQLAPGRFVSLENSVFGKNGRFQKRNGFQRLTSLPDSSSTLVTTFNGDLTAIGTSLNAYTAANSTWVEKGTIQPCQLDVLPLIRNNTNQSQADSAVANGFVCTAYTDQDPTNLANKIYRYAIADVATGQNIVAPTTITDADATYGTPKVFVLGNYFIIIFTNKVSTTYHLKFIAISTSSPAANNTSVDISTSYTPATTLNFDAAVLGSTLYVAWNGAASSGVKMAYVTASLSVSSSVTVDASHVATLMSVCTDMTNNTVWAVWYDLATTKGYAACLSPQLAILRASTQVIASGTVLNITSAATAGTVSFFYELSNNYSYDSSVPSHFVNKNTFTQAGVLGTASTMLRSVGLASKAFWVDGTIYMALTYSSPYQPTYFLSNSSGSLIAKLAYSNGGGYLVNGLPSVTVSGSTASVTYLIKDLIQAVNKDTNVTAGTQTAGIYSQTGINLATYTIGGDMVSAEIGNNLNMSGGFMWSYDGYAATEQGFHVYPDSVEVTTSGAGGSISAQKYYYVATYEWTDNQGNAFRSAPSIPVSVTTTGATSTNTINVPTLRLTYKTANPVKIVIYRWSAAQQIYYQVTSISSPVLNSLTTDSVSFADTQADATILGNNILYTTGGVLENIAPPAVKTVALFDDRLWALSAEDGNMLLFSKQVIEATPVEMSDLLSIYVAPTQSSQGSTGPGKCLSAMDDKLILFKKDAMYYLNGTGPDNTGANNQYGNPVLISSTVGCENQKSIVFTPNGLMFQSDKGIWLLSRDLSTQYIGAAVEVFNEYEVTSAVCVPGTNQVRFALSNGVTLMYDYFYGQWGTFTNVASVSSTLFESLHTYIDSFGRVFQEAPGTYVDGSSPVLMSFTTGWLNLAGLQGYQRAYFFYLLANYLSPHKLQVQIAYDFAPSPSQSVIISPDNYSAPYGGDPTYGDSAYYGGYSQLEQWRVFFEKQRCQSFQITVKEIFDPSLGVAPGAGFTMSGIDLVFGVRKGYPNISPSRSTG